MALVQTSVKIEPWHLEVAKAAKLNISHLLRTAIEAAIHTGEDIEKEEADIQKQKAIIAAREEMLFLRKSRKTQADKEFELFAFRRQYIQDHTEILTQYRNNSISSKGYTVLQTELKFFKKEELLMFLNKLNGATATA